MNADKIESCTVLLAIIAQALVCSLFFCNGATNPGSLMMGIILFCSFLMLDVPVLYSTGLFKK